MVICFCQGEDLIVAVDADGCFTEKITDFAGCYVKDADKAIIKAVKASDVIHFFNIFYFSHLGIFFRNTSAFFLFFYEFKYFIVENKIGSPLIANNFNFLNVSANVWNCNPNMHYFKLLPDFFTFLSCQKSYIIN